jgi:hypothetical protein
LDPTSLLNPTIETQSSFKASAPVVNPDAIKLPAKMSVLVGPLVSVEPFAPMFERTTPAWTLAELITAMAAMTKAITVAFIEIILLFLNQEKMR